MKKKSFKYFGEGFAVFLSLIIAIPIYMLVINSFKDKAGAAKMNLSLPREWHIVDNYITMFKSGGVGRAFLNSMVNTSICVFLIILLSSTTAFIIQRRKTKLTKLIFNLIIIGMIMPVSIIPAYFICKYLYLTKTILAASVMLTTTNFSFAVFLYVSGMKGIAKEIDEAALLDGCGTLRLFFNVIFPLLKPVTATMIIIAFMNVWNDMGISIYFLTSPKKYTLPLTTFMFFGEHFSDWHLVFANVVTISIPVVIVYLLLQKYIISGMTAGSIKG